MNAIRIGFFPGDSDAHRWEREIHPWPRLATDALADAGHDVVGLGIGDLRRASVLSTLDVLHLNWPQSLMQPKSRRFRGKALRYVYRRWFFSTCIRSVNRLKQSGVPVVWQIHDLPHTSRRDDQELMDFLFQRFYELAGGLLFSEASAREPFFQKFGPPGGKLIGTAPLGDYSKLHGPARSKEAARTTLGLGDARKVFLYPGTVRWTRNPAGFIGPFLSHSDPRDILIISGRGTAGISHLAVPNRVVIKPGAIEHEEFRDLLCAADYIVNDAPQYLGSAIIRAALGYGVPVIAHSFGCTSDLAKGAYIPIPEVTDGVAKALQIALAIDPAEHRRMSEQAVRNHLARPWSAYAAGCSELYSRLLIRSQQPIDRAHD